MESNSETYRYNSVDAARYIAASANERHITVNITKIQKLLYIAYGVFLAIKGERLINEHSHAWPYGPVFPTVRDKLLKADLYSISKKENCPHDMLTDEDLNALMELVFRDFGGWSAAQLSDWSCQDGTSWQRAVSSADFKWGNIIPDDYIREYFNSILVHL